MPSATDFKRAFGLTNGSEVGTYVVASSHVGHEVKEVRRRWMPRAAPVALPPWVQAAGMAGGGASGAGAWCRLSPATLCRP